MTVMVIMDGAASRGGANQKPVIGSCRTAAGRQSAPINITLPILDALDYR